jgi:ketosteroid isomerase-like protein
MALSNIPPAISALFSSVQATDLAALRQAIADEAIIADRGITYRGPEATRHWLEDFTRNGPVNIRPINLARRLGTIVVTAVVKGIADRDKAGSDQLDWHFSVSGDKVSAVTVLQTTWPDMPVAVTAFVRATNAFDLPELLNSFSDDALVNDQFQNHWGKDAIRHWASRDVTGEHLTMYISAVSQHYGCTIVTANVDGEYDKRGLPEPLMLEFFFETVKQKIVQLIVLRHHD